MKFHYLAKGIILKEGNVPLHIYQKRIISSRQSGFESLTKRTS